jgi:ATP dependent DNA ligase domain
LVGGTLAMAGHPVTLLVRPGRQNHYPNQLTVESTTLGTFEARLPSAEAILHKLGTCTVESKYDGFRCQVHKSGEEVRVFSRGLEDLTGVFPEIAEGRPWSPVPATGLSRRHLLTRIRKVRCTAYHRRARATKTAFAPTLNQRPSTAPKVYPLVSAPALAGSRSAASIFSRTGIKYSL